MNNAPKPLPPLTPKDIARFWSHVDVRGPNECWPWKLSCFDDGYGQFKARGRNLKAHRVAFFLAHGYDPGDSLALHSCDNPPCCNGAHLFDGDEAANSADCKAKGRLNTPSGARHGSKTQPESRARGERVAGAKLTAEQVAEARALYLTGEFSHEDLAVRFGVTRRGIGRVLSGENWKHIGADVGALAAMSQQRRGSTGERNPSAKLTESDVREIRALYAVGNVSYSSLAARFGATKESIAAIVKRRCWKHVI